MVLYKIFSHPALQLLSFAFLLVGSAYYGGPYIFFLYHGVQEVLSYAIVGWMGIVITTAGLFFSGRSQAVLQFIGLCVMAVSLLVFIFSAERLMNIWVWRQLVPLLTLLVFIAICVLVIKKFIKSGGL